MNFYNQRANLRKLHRDQFTSINDVNEFSSSAGNPLNKRDGNTYIYLKESLTKINSLLLKKEKWEAKNLYIHWLHI